MATYEELIAKSKELAAAGRMDDAKRVAEIALKTRNATPAAPKGNWFQRNILPDDDPDSLNAGETIAAMLNKGAEGMSYGLLGDEAGAWVNSRFPGYGTYDEELAKRRKQEDLLWEKSPALSIGSELGGALAGTILPGKALKSAADAGSHLAAKAGNALNAITGSQPGSVGVLKSGALGAMGAGTYGFMEGEGGFDNRLKSGRDASLVGAGAGIAAPLLGKAVQKGGDAAKRFKFNQTLRRTAPMADELFDEARPLYRQIDNADVRLRPDFVGQTADDIKAYLKEHGSDYVSGFDNMPASRFANEAVSEVGERVAKTPAPVPFEELRRMRSNISRRATDSAKDVSRSYDAEVAGGVADKFSKMFDNVPPQAVASGDASALAVLPKANEIWARAHKSKLVEEAVEGADNYISNKASGIKNRLKSLLSNKATRDKFTDAEKAALRRVIHGGVLDDYIDDMGGGMARLLQGSVGGGIGFAAGGPLGAAAGTLIGTIPGNLAKRASEGLTARRADIARALIASGKAGLPVPTTDPKVRSIVESLMRRTGAATGQGL